MGKTIVIIPLGTGSKWDNNELKFALRSIEKNLTRFNEVLIVGDDCPAWLKVGDGLKFVRCPDPTPFPAINTLHKVWEALAHTNAEQFLLTYDDVFLNKPFFADHFPTYYNGDLSQFLKLRGDYKQSCILTFKWLTEHGYPTKKFGVHCPFLFATEVFIEVVKLFKNQEPGLLYKSIYGNMALLNVQPKRDIIINLPLNLPGKIDTLPFYSIRPGRVNDEMQTFFQEQFPNKSCFEL
jgi:hypothetical protein